MNRSRYVLAVAVVATLVVASAVGGGQSTVTTSPERRVAENGTNGSIGGRTTATVPRHRDPDRVQQRGDSAAVERWLRERLAQRLGNSMVRVKRGQYEKARGIVGDRFSNQLGQYVEVQQSTPGNPNHTEQFRQGKENQRKFIDSVQEYRRTYKQYREARRNGNTKRARQQARRLDQLAERTNQSGASLKSTYRNVSGTTGVDLNRSSRQVTTISRNISTTQSSVESAVFKRTELNVTAQSNHVSFLDPMNLTGVLTTANGSRISNRNVTLDVGNRTIETRTDGDGRFTASYRPTTLPLNKKRLTVRYHPLNESAYLESTDTVAANVTQVDSTLGLTRTPNETRFGKPVVVSGTVGAKGVSAGDVPVVVSIGDQRIGTTTTGPNGTFTVRTRLPSSIRSGNRTLRATVPLSEKALSGANATRKLRVERTNTSLSMDAARNGSRVEAHGRLRVRNDTAVNDTAVTDGTVVIRVNGNRVTSVETGPNGSYNATFELPSSVGPDQSATVVAAYEPPPSNLENAQASDVVEPVSKPVSLLGWISLPWAGAALLTLVFLLGTVFVRSRRSDDMDGVDEGLSGGEDARDDSTDGDVEQDSSETEDDAANELDALDTARTRLSSGDHERAVKIGYAAFRRYLLRNYDLTPWATPRELRDAAESVVTDREYQTLADLTTCYERVVFASDGISTDTVSVLLDAADGIVTDERMDQGTDERPGEDTEP
ncbi:hypothetical protein [Haladaptatus sp. T7]|uniref:hypothetical protein n=1 Tax=Haladaptatus sp. T7 TaxID=2029368 RepID=UPI0022329B6E|nr:hypothetical protein [Haladaptatus sp. T7]